MIDLHIHILPEVDDGATSFEEAVIMAKEAVDSGVERMVVTPHCHQIRRFENYYGSEMEKKFTILQKTLEEANIPLKLYLGMEIFANDYMVDKIKNGEIIGLNFSDYYLIEFSVRDHPLYIEKVLDNVMKLNKIPIIAHPERYLCVQINPQIVMHWRKKGCYFQGNKDSFFGLFGLRAQQCVIDLLRHRLLSVVASDAHGVGKRHARLDEIQDFIELYYGIDVADILLNENPRRIIDNRKNLL